MKNNLKYYSHDVDSHNHWKFKTLRRKYKWCGEGKFWALNNMIAEADGCRLDIRDSDKKASIAADLDFDITEFEQFVEYLAHVCKLVIYAEGHLTTEKTQENLVGVNDKRERQRNWKKEKSTPNNEKSTSTLEESTVEKEQTKLNEIKLNETKEELGEAPAVPALETVGKKKSKRKEFIPPTQQEIQKFFIETIGAKWGDSKARTAADAYLDHYTANGWVQNKGKPIVDWKAAARGWIRRDLNGEFSAPRYEKSPVGAQRQVASMPHIPAVEKPIPAPQLTKEEADQRMNEFVNDLYGEYLAGSLRFEFLVTSAYDHIKSAGLMKMPQAATDQIMIQAREKRMNELAGSKTIEDAKLLSLYHGSPDCAEVKNDKGFLKMGKRLAILEFFGLLKARNEQFVFKLNTNSHGSKAQVD